MTVATITRKRTLSAFLRTAQGQSYYVPSVHSRLLAAGDFKSFAALQRWMRERYPVEYKKYHFLAGRTGREQLQRMWADYLKWSGQ